MSISSSSLQHVVGLGSGMDYQTMITQLMQAEATPQNQLKQKLTKLQWTEDAYRSMNLAFTTFQGQIQSLQYSTGWNQQSATSSNSSVLTATVNGGATTGSHTISVSQLATGASLSGAGGITASGTFVGSANVSGGLTIATGSNDSMSMTLNGVTKTVTVAAGTYSTASALQTALQTAVNSAFGTGQVTVGTSGNNLSFTPAQANATFSVAANGSNTGFQSMLGTITPIFSPITGNTNLSSGLNIVAGQNDTLSVSLNGLSKVVTIAAGNYSSLSSLQSAVQTAMDQAFNANQVTVGISGNSLTFAPVSAGGFSPQFSISTNGASTAYSQLIDNSGTTTSASYKVDPAATLNSQAGKMGFNPSSSFLTGSTYSFTINGQQIQYTGSDTINSIIQKVNSSVAGVTMSYNSVTDSVSFATKGTGATAVINFGSDSGNLLQALHVEDGSGKVTATGTIQGQNALVSIDGVSTQQSSNSFTMSGVNYTLLSTTASSGPVTLNVSSNTDAIIKQITDFVNNYNTIISQMSTKLNEKTYRDYQPLTSDQQAQMTDSQISAWNQKAQSGLLHNDDIVQTAYNNFRLTTYNSVPGTSTYNALYEIGITSYSYSQFQNDPTSAGKLNLDTAKLQQALATNPNDVATIMENVTQQLNKQSQNAVNSIITRAGYSGTAYDSVTTTIGLQASHLETQISDWDTRLASIQQQYYTMFTAMDKAVAENNQQLAYLQSALK